MALKKSELYSSLWSSCDELRGGMDNLNQNEELALSIDATIRKTRPDGWRGIQAREQVIKAALFDVLRDVGDSVNLTWPTLII